MVEIKLATFQDVLPLWQLLWQSRKDINQASSMCYLGGYDMSYYKNSVSFIVAEENSNIVGVNSGFLTGDLYRSRGLFVLPEYRGNSLSTLLLNATTECAKKEGAVGIWSYPRKQSLYAYESAGFSKTSDWEKADFGENCYVLKSFN